MLRLYAHLRSRPAVHLPDHDRRQRQHRPDLGDRLPAGARGARGAGRPPVGQGSRPGAEPGLGRQRCGGPGLHGRRPVHGPRRGPAAAGPAALRALGPGHRHPPGSRLAGRPRAEAGAHLPDLQPDRAHQLWARGSPMPSAGSRRSAPTRRPSCCRWSRTPSGSSTPSCWCSPSGRGCASTRFRSTGSTTRARPWTSSTRRARTSPGPLPFEVRFERSECRALGVSEKSHLAAGGDPGMATRGNTDEGAVGRQERL